MLLQVEAAEAKGKVIILLYALWLHAVLHMLESYVLHEPFQLHIARLLMSRHLMLVLYEPRARM